MPSTIPTPTPTPTYAITPTETAGWQTHRNERFGFEFQYPEDWTIGESSIGVLELTDPRGVKNISISSFDEGTRGITYCEAYPRDTPRCEQNRVDDLYGLIDWGVDTTTANALFDSLFVTLTVQRPQQIDSETKEMFRAFLSTFQFIEPINQNRQDAQKGAKKMVEGTAPTCAPPQFNIVRFYTAEKRNVILR